MKIKTDAVIRGIEIELDEKRVIAKMIRDILGKDGHRSFCRKGKRLFYEDNPYWSEHDVREYVLINDEKTMQKFLLLVKLYKVISGEDFCEIREV